jgi:hypothetical protein
MTVDTNYTSTEMEAGEDDDEEEEVKVEEYDINEEDDV